MRRTHKQLATELGMPVNAVAIIREVLAGTSADSQLARSQGGDHPAAAQWLSDHRRGRLTITPQMVEAVGRANGTL